MKGRIMNKDQVTSTEAAGVHTYQFLHPESRKPEDKRFAQGKAVIEHLAGVRREAGFIGFALAIIAICQIVMCAQGFTR